MSLNSNAFIDVSSDKAAALAAFRAAMGLPAPAPVQAVEYVSNGRTLIIGAADIALDWAERLKDRLEVAVLVTEARGNEELPPRADYAIAAGREVQLDGWLGHYRVRWQGLDMPSVGLIGTLDFAAAATSQQADYDLILDFSRQALINLPHPPQGYFAPGRDPIDQFDAVLKLTALVGEFEKPRYFDYKADQCAHSRNRIDGCNNCIDICSTGAITAKGDGVVVEPHLCMGCGACASSCPTGAMRYAYPSVPELGARLKAMLVAYREAGGSDPVIVFHERQGEDWLLRLAHRQGLPGNVIPVAVHDIASLGPDLLLGALCYGAAHVAILKVADLTDAYLANLRKQLALVQTLVNGFGFAGQVCGLIDGNADLTQLATAPLQLKPATFNLFTEKRRTLDFCIDHLQSQAPQAVESIDLPAGSPFGTLSIDAQRCTLCMSCVGACPAKALQDNPELPQLRFIEHNCVQCGICVDTCPESALSKSTRLLLSPEAKQPRVLNEAQPFHCVRCGTPFGTKAMVDSMLKRLSGHSLFADAKSQRRLQMCSDCRVIDMLENQSEMKVEDLPR